MRDPSPFVIIPLGLFAVFVLIPLYLFLAWTFVPQPKH